MENNKKLDIDSNIFVYIIYNKLFHIKGEE